MFQSSFRKKGSSDESAWSGWIDHVGVESARSILRLNESAHHDWEYRLRVVKVFAHDSSIGSKAMAKLLAADALMNAAGTAQAALKESEDKVLRTQAWAQVAGKVPAGCKCDPLELGWLGRHVFSALHHRQNGCTKPYFKNTTAQ